MIFFLFPASYLCSQMIFQFSSSCRSFLSLIFFFVQPFVCSFSIGVHLCFLFIFLCLPSLRTLTLSPFCCVFLYFYIPRIASFHHLPYHIAPSVLVDWFSANLSVSPVSCACPPLCLSNCLSSSHCLSSVFICLLFLFLSSCLWACTGSDSVSLSSSPLSSTHWHTQKHTHIYTPQFLSSPSDVDYYLTVWISERHQCPQRGIKLAGALKAMICRQCFEVLLMSKYWLQHWQGLSNSLKLACSSI